MNFNSTSPATPVATGVVEATTGGIAFNAVTGANYNSSTSTLTLNRAGGAPDLAMTTNGSFYEGINAYQATGTEQGTAIVAQTANGAGYAVAAYDHSASTSLDPQISVLIGGDQTTAPTQSAIGGAKFEGQYLGYIRETTAGSGFVDGTVAGDASMTINAAGTGFNSGTIISNRQAAAGGTTIGSLADITTTGGTINSSMVFNGGLATTDLLGNSVIGRTDGAFFDATASNPTGEAIGTVILTGGSTCTTLGNIKAPGSVCVIETGTFTATKN